MDVISFGGSGMERYNGEVQMKTNQRGFFEASMKSYFHGEHQKEVRRQGEGHKSIGFFKEFGFFKFNYKLRGSQY